MRRYCFTMTIRPGQEGEYDRRHREVWPELIAELRAAGVANYSLFRRGTHVIAYAECTPDGPESFAAVARTDVNSRWSQWFGDVLVAAPEDEHALSGYAEVWHMPE